MDEIKTGNVPVTGETVYEEDNRSRADIQAEVDEVMKKYDRESNTRVWEGWRKYLVLGVEAAFALFCIFVTDFG